MCGLGAIDTVLGGQVQVKLKPDWLEKHTGKYLMGFGDPSDSKTPSLEEMFAPVFSSVAAFAAAVRPFLSDDLLTAALGSLTPPRAVMKDIIPAGAGSTARRPGTPHSSSDHPRRRGVDTTPASVSRARTGRSPQARGRLPVSGRVAGMLSEDPRRRGVDTF
ncbi:hypothetical protein ACFQ9Q_40740 [Streptomyces virginiae]|uniref:hypothetical protein n=1 Tax=Streptomyces virginiae TaxID=1961 RepID=UPI00369E9459